MPISLTATTTDYIVPLQWVVTGSTVSLPLQFFVLDVACER